MSAPWGCHLLCMVQDTTSASWGSLAQPTAHDLMSASWGSHHPAKSPWPHVSPLVPSASALAMLQQGWVSSSPQPCLAMGLSESGPPVGPHPSLSPSPERSLTPGLGLPLCPSAALLLARAGMGPDGPLELWELLVQAGCCQWALGKTNESSHLRHMVLLCTLLLLLLLNEQLLLLPAPGCSQFFKASLHLLQHLGSVAYHQLDTVLSCLQQLHCLLVVLSFHTLGAGRTDSVRKMLLWSRALPSFWYGKAVGVLESFHPLHFSRDH